MCNTHTIDFNAPFIEATIPGVKQYRTSMKQVKEAVGLMFQGVLPQIFRIVQSAALRDENGTLDTRHKDRVLREVGELVQGLFVADGRFAFADDGVTARTPFAQLLNGFYVRVTIEAVQQQRSWLSKKLPTDIFQYLSRAQALPLGEADNLHARRDDESDDAFRQRMDDLRIFRRQPFADLDPNRQWVPMHLWNDPNGYRLSDRIWNASIETRRTIDQIISQAFTDGTGAFELSRLLESSLLPDAKLIRTTRPYNRDSSLFAMRLARTEIARAANHASFIAAYLNPYVSGIDVVRSRNGDPNCRICPQHATIDISGNRVREPYSMDAANVPPYHPHDMCHVSPVVTDSIATVTARIRAAMEGGMQPGMNPAAIEVLLQWLLGILFLRFISQMDSGDFDLFNL